MDNYNQVSIPQIEYDNESNRALELVEYLSETENVPIMECIINEIIDNIVYKQNKDVIGIINNYDYVMPCENMNDEDEVYEF